MEEPFCWLTQFAPIVASMLVMVTRMIGLAAAA